MKVKEEGKLIKSVSYDQEEIIEDILNLYVKAETFDADVTYSKGVFYKNIKRPKLCYDIEPKFNYVEKCDCRRTPLENESIFSLMYDPPFLATKGGSLKESNGNNLIAQRFGVYEDEKELHRFYIDSLKEFYRVLKQDGILVVKCQDKVSSGKQYFSHNFIINQAEKIGFYTKDLFILLAKSRIVADWQKQNQKHARKFHSYFIVFQKKNVKHIFKDLEVEQ